MDSSARFHAGFKIGARRQLDDAFAGQCRIQRIELAGVLPLGVEFIQLRCGGHDFTIQLGDLAGKAGRDRRVSAIVLQSYDTSFCIECTVGIAQTQLVGKLQRQVRGK